MELETGEFQAVFSFKQVLSHPVTGEEREISFDLQRERQERYREIGRNMPYFRFEAILLCVNGDQDPEESLHHLHNWMDEAARYGSQRAMNHLCIVILHDLAGQRNGMGMGVTTESDVLPKLKEFDVDINFPVFELNLRDEAKIEATLDEFTRQLWLRSFEDLDASAKRGAMDKYFPPEPTKAKTSKKKKKKEEQAAPSNGGEGK